MAAGPSTWLAQGAEVRGPAEIGDGSGVLETCSFVGWADSPLRIGRRTVFGHRCVVLGATVGDLCEIGNGTVILDGAELGDRVMTGESCLVPPGSRVPDGVVIVGSPYRIVRDLSDDDLARLTRMRGGALDLPPHRLDQHAGGSGMTGTLHTIGGHTPEVGEGTVLFDTAELSGDVVVGRDGVIAGGVKIIGDSHGPVRIGDRVQILENAVLHLLPDAELTIGDDVTIGPGCVVHGCRLGDGVVVEASCNVSDFSTIGAGSVVRAGSVVTQRSTFDERTVIEGFPAKATGTLDQAPGRPPWARSLAAVQALGGG